MSTNGFTLGQRKISIDQAFKLASEHHSAGRQAQAEELASQIVRLEPRHAFAWQLLAVIAHSKGDIQKGIELLGKAIQCHPMVAQFFLIARKCID